MPRTLSLLVYTLVLILLGSPEASALLSQNHVGDEGRWTLKNRVMGVAENTPLNDSRDPQLTSKLATGYGSGGEKIASGQGDGAIGDLAKLGRTVEDAAPLAKEGIYEFTAASGKTYVGQSGNIANRITQHINDGKLLQADISTVSTTEVLGGKTSREVAEQLRINELGGVDKLENINNPIGPNRQSLMPKQ